MYKINLIKIKSNQIKQVLQIEENPQFNYLGTYLICALILRIRKM